MNIKEVIKLYSDLPDKVSHIDLELETALSKEDQLHLSAILLKQGFSVQAVTSGFKTSIKAVKK